jgi:hypothetical protein
MSQLCEVCEIPRESCYCSNSELDFETEQQLLRKEEDASVEETKEHLHQIENAKNLVLDAYSTLVSTSQRQLVPCLEELSFDNLFRLLYPEVFEKYESMFLPSVSGVSETSTYQEGKIIVGRVSETSDKNDDLDQKISSTKCPWKK